MEKCPMCGSRLAENTEELAQAEFKEAMEWYFNRDETSEWQEYQEWKSRKVNQT